METGYGFTQSLGRVLDAVENSSPLESLEAVTRGLRAGLGATDVAMLMADLSGHGLVRLASPDEQESDGTGGADRGEEPDVVAFDGGPLEQTMRAQRVRVLAPGTLPGGGPTDDSWTVLAPVTERGEALGLLELSLPVEPTAEVLVEVTRTAHVLAFVIIASRRHTDLFEWGQRSTTFTLPAEIQRRLLPAAFTCEAGLLTLSAWLEPADDVGGDTFDYSLGHDVLHLSVTDAMGHGVASALTATLCVGSLRNTRRGGASLLQQADAANTALFDHCTSIGDEGFVTGLLGRLDLATGALSLVNAGHVLPYLARDGDVSRIELTAGLPLGLFAGTTYEVDVVPLQPGDRVVLVTDGMLERKAAALDLVTQIRVTRDLHPRQAARRLAADVLNAVGTDLPDDATLLVLDWHGPHREERATVAGADQQHAAGSQ